MNFKEISILIIVILFCILISGCVGESDDNMDKGITSLKNEDYSSAIKYFDNVIEKNPNAKLAWFQKGYAYFKLGDYESAKVAYNQVVKIDPSEASCGGGDALRCYDAVERVIDE